MTARGAFRQPGFGLLFGGMLASIAGDSLMLIVLAVWVKDLTGSNGAAGATFLCMAAPSLLAPIVGMLIDRAKRRPALIVINVASALAVLPLLAVRDRDDVWIIYTVAVAYGFSMVAAAATLNGLLKVMLADSLLVDANASLATSKEALRLVGPLAGAGLYTWLGGGGVAVIDALSFLVAATALAVLPVREPKPTPEEGGWRQEFMAGIHHVWRDRVLAHTLLATGLSLLVIGFMESAVFAVADAFDRPASFVGVLVSVQGIGAVSGGLSASWLIRRQGEVSAVVGSLLTLALGLALCAVSAHLEVLFVGVVVLGFSLPVFIVALTTLLQVRTPPHLMGRVSTASDIILGTPQALSIAAGAVLVSRMGYRDIYWICAVVITASAAYLAVALRSTLGQSSDRAASLQPDPRPAD